MSSRVSSALLPTHRSRNTSILWMVFSTIWVGILVGSAISYFHLPGGRVSDPSIALGWRLLAIGLVAAFIGVYAYTVYRMYFNRSSWLIVFDRSEIWWIRGSITALAIAMNLLPEGRSADWQASFMFVAIAWALTSNHMHAIASVFQAAGIAAVTLIATGRGDILAGTMLYVIGFGLMVAGYVMMNGLVGELMIERGRVADQAVTEERFRLARDLHDTVGHSMTQITLKTELARRLVSADPDRAARELADVEHLSRTLSAEVRRSIAGNIDLSLEHECSRAIELLESLDISVVVHGEIGSVPTHIADTFAWCLREGVMNVAKHSGATRCHITIDARGREHTLVIEDNGVTPNGTSPDGQGIGGMKQRVNAYQGTVGFATTAEGHRLEVRITA